MRMIKKRFPSASLWGKIESFVDQPIYIEKNPCSRSREIVITFCHIIEENINEKCITYSVARGSQKDCEDFE